MTETETATVVAYEPALGRPARVGTWNELAKGTFRVATEHLERGDWRAAAELVEISVTEAEELRDVQVRMREQIDHLLTDLLERCCRSVRPREVRRLVAVVDGAVLGGLGELDPDPRSLARGILLDVVETVAPPVED